MFSLNECKIGGLVLRFVSSFMFIIPNSQKVLVYPNHYSCVNFPGRNESLSPLIITKRKKDSRRSTMFLLVWFLLLSLVSDKQICTPCFWCQSFFSTGIFQKLWKHLNISNEHFSIGNDYQYGFRSTGDLLSYVSPIWTNIIENYRKSRTVALDISKSCTNVIWIKYQYIDYPLTFTSV